MKVTYEDSHKNDIFIKENIPSAKAYECCINYKTISHDVLNRNDGHVVHHHLFVIEWTNPVRAVLIISF